jgi:hypothetical protein
MQTQSVISELNSLYYELIKQIGFRQDNIDANSQIELLKIAATVQQTVFISSAIDEFTEAFSSFKDGEVEDRATYFNSVDKIADSLNSIANSLELQNGL